MRTNPIAAAVLAAMWCLVIVPWGLGAQNEKPSEAETQTAESGTPSLIGKWGLVKDKSDFGGMPAPEKMERVIAGRDATITVTTKKFEGEKPTDVVMKYFTNGFETKNFVKSEDRFQNAYSVGSWEGGVLSITTHMQDPQGGYIVILDKWEVSKDKKTMTTTTKIDTTRGEINSKLIWEKAGT